MNRAALVTLALVLATGGWLCTAPFLLHWQPRGGHWSTATRCDVFIGGVLAAAGFLSLFAALTGHVQDLYARRR